MTSHSWHSLCSLADPLRPDDPRDVGAYRIDGRVSADGGTVLYAAHLGGQTPVLLELARGGTAEGAPPEPAGRGVCTVGADRTGLQGGRPWAVLPDQPGPDLRRRVTGHGALPERDAVVVAAAVAQALAVLHGEGTVHGAVGPDAVVLTGAGPRLLDTGLGRRAGAPAEPGLRGVPGRTAPEVCRGGRPTAAADMFGWAVLVALAATGREPFGESPASRLGYRAARVEMERRVLQDAPDLDGVPEALMEAVARALSPEPGERPAASDALAAALRYLDGRDGAPTEERLRAALPGGGGPGLPPASAGTAAPEPVTPKGTAAAGAAGRGALPAPTPGPARTAPQEGTGAAGPAPDGRTALWTGLADLAVVAAAVLAVLVVVLSHTGVL